MQSSVFTFRVLAQQKDGVGGSFVRLGRLGRPGITPRKTDCRAVLVFGVLAGHVFILSHLVLRYRFVRLWNFRYALAALVYYSGMQKDV